MVWLPVLFPAFVLAAVTALPAQHPTEAAEVAATSSPLLVEVFQAGERGYHTFRIPAIVRLPDGDLLAFAEGRLNGSGDSGDVDVVMKRSVDEGQSWGPLQVIADNGPGLFGNPSPVVDQESGDVLLVLVRQPEHCHEAQIRAGEKGYRDPYLMRSSDGGRLWTGPRPLSATADRPGWRWYATGPCHAIQLRHGRHAGRLVVPANFSVAEGPQNRFLGAHLLLSDDGGRSWRIGAVDDSHLGTDVLNPSETAVVERVDGILYVNTRDQHGSSEGTRGATSSADGGESFQAPFAPVPDLAGPVCQGALLHGGRLRGGELLLYSGPADPAGRRRLAIRASLDGGRSWSEAAVLYQESAAYSDLVALGEDRYGCLFEADGYRRILFTPFDREQLELGPTTD